MEGTYEVMQNGQAVGMATVTREGMYYHIGCQCQLDGNNMYRLIMVFNNDQCDLGILIPKGKCFGLHARINTKVLGKGTPEFIIMPRRESLQRNFVRLCPEEPFRYLSRLEDAYLVRHKGENCLGFRDKK